MHWSEEELPTNSELLGPHSRPCTNQDKNKPSSVVRDRGRILDAEDPKYVTKRLSDSRADDHNAIGLSVDDSLSQMEDRCQPEEYGKAVCRSNVRTECPLSVWIIKC